MDEKSRIATPSRELASWKEIADYLAVTVRTAQNWEPERGLPVHRVPGGRGRVYALTAELDAWKEAGSDRPPRNGATVSGVGKTRKLLLVLAVLLVVACAVAFILTRRPGTPALWRVERNTLIVSDDGGRELWRKSFAENLITEQYNHSVLQGRNKVWFGDVNDDGKAETLFTIVHSTEGAEAGVLVCLSNQGLEEWRFTPGRRVHTATEYFSSHYRIMRVAVAPLVHQYPKAILVVSYNYPDYPTQVALLSPRGDLLREYWHSGDLGGDFGSCEWLRIADLNRDGKNEIYLGGVNNAYKQATLVVLDPETMGGASVEENPAYQLQGFAPGKEIGRVLFPRSCINRIKHEYNGVIDLYSDGGSLSVSVMEEMTPPASALFYDLDAALRLRSFRTSDSFRSRHLQLFNAKELDHQWSTNEEAEMHHIRVFCSTDVKPNAQATKLPKSKGQ